MAFARFMATMTGRLLRFALGLVLFALGVIIGGAAGVVLLIVSVIPMIAAAFNVCLIAPLIGAPFSGTAALAAPRKIEPKIEPPKVEPPSPLAGSH